MREFLQKTGLYGVLALVLIFTVPAQDGPQPGGYQPHLGREVPVAFYYPSSWTVVDADESVGIVSRPALAEQLGSDQPEIRTGDAMLALGVIPAAFLEMMGANPGELDSVVETLFAGMSTEQGEIDRAERESFDFNAGEVESVLFDAGPRDEAGLMLVSHESAEVIAFGMAFGYRNDLVAYRQELAQVLATVEFTGSMQDFYDG
jgi:hypothetical protein